MLALRNLAALTLVLALGGHATETESITQLATRAYARAWLHAHEDPDTAGLGELKSTNPEAFAIVEALMAKQKLGLLNPKHPTTSMRSAPSEEGFGGAAVIAAAQSGAAETEAPAPPAQKSWLNWKPAAHDDDALVQNVLGSVAGMVAAKDASPPEMKSSSAAVERGWSADAASGFGLRASVPAAQPSSALAPAAVSNAASALAAVSTNKAPASEYMEELGLVKKSTAVAPGKLSNALTSFSFDDATSFIQEPTAHQLSLATAGQQVVASAIAAMPDSEPSVTPGEEAKLAMGYGALGNYLTAPVPSPKLNLVQARSATAPNVEDEVKKERQMDVYIHDGFGAAEQADAKHEKEVNANKNLKP